MTLQELSDEDYDRMLQPLWSFLAPTQVPAASNLIFVFGGIDLAVPTRAAELYRLGFAPRIVISGGAGLFTKQHFGDRTEADVFADQMVSQGIPRRDILLEHKATNTRENVMNGMATLLDLGVTVSSALLVAKPFLMRRCLATFEKCFPTVLTRSCPPEGGPSKYCDRSRSDFAERLVAEVERLINYAAKGDIASVDVPKEVASTCDNLRTSRFR